MRQSGELSQQRALDPEYDWFYESARTERPKISEVPSIVLATAENIAFVGVSLVKLPVQGIYKAMQRKRQNNG